MANSEKDEAASVARERQERYIEGLRAELEGYRRSGKDSADDRAKQVIAELRRLKVNPDGPSGRQAPAKETAATEKPPAQ